MKIQAFGKSYTEFIYQVYFNSFSPNVVLNFLKMYVK